MMPNPGCYAPFIIELIEEIDPDEVIITIGSQQL